MSGKYKKIFFTVTNDLVTDQRMQRITQTLASSGWDVTLIGRKRDPGQLSREVKNNVRWIRFQLFFSKGKLFYIEYNLRLFFFFLFKRSYLLSAVDFDTLLNAYMLKVLAGRDFVFDSHEYFTEVPELEGRAFAKSVWRYLGNVAVPKAIQCYTVNRSLAGILSDEFGNTFDYIRNLPYRADCEEFHTPGSEQRIILYQGALNVGRGIEQGIEALRYLPREYIFWIAGTGDIDEELKEYTRELQLEERVIFLGRLDPQELKNVTQQAWCGLNMLEGSSYNYYYSLANKFFDYVNAAVPAINMYFPEYVSLNKEYEVSVLVKQCTAEAIADAVQKLENPDFYQRLRLNCKNASAIWNWENESQKLSGIYKKYQE